MQHCAECGSDRPAHVPPGLCPHCALAVDLKADSGEIPPFRRSFGDYELLEEIAKGGMGVVYRARQKSLDRIVAVKMLRSGFHADFDTIRRFRVEAVVAGSLKHPNIVPVHEVGEYDDRRFIVMDFVPGGNLAQFANQPLPPKRAAELLVTIATAIHYAHQHRILHRDIKPSNILMDDDSQPHVTDFGLAKGLRASQGDESLEENHATAELNQRRTADGQILGSPAYMPPEQADPRRGPVGRYSDVYSLGAMLYQLLTRRPPFEGAGVADTLHRLLHDDVVSPRRFNASIPLDLETICLKCLEKDPARRYQTAQELAKELGRFLCNEPVLARPMGRPEKVWRWCRRNPMAVAFLLTLCVALGLSLALLDRVNRERVKQKALNQQLSDNERKTRDLRREQLNLTREALDSLWANRELRSREVKSATIAAMAEIPVLAVTNPVTLVQWTMGVAAQDSPAARVRNYALLISELESRASQRLGREVRVNIKLYKFPEEFQADLYAGKVDFGRIAALPFVRSLKIQPALIPLAMPTTSYKQWVFFTRTNSSLRSIQEIAGHRVAFGDTNATVSYWAQIQLIKNGIHATQLSGYDFLNSTLDFEDYVHAFGYTNALDRIGYLHSHAQVIEGVLKGDYDVGVARLKAFQIHEARGLAAIPGTEFESSRNLFVARPGLDPEFSQTLISTITSLEGHWLEALPDQSPGYQVVTTNAFRSEDQWLERVEAAFPPKPSPRP